MINGSAYFRNMQLEVSNKGGGSGVGTTSCTIEYSLTNMSAQEITDLKHAMGHDKDDGEKKSKLLRTLMSGDTWPFCSHEAQKVKGKESAPSVPLPCQWATLCYVPDIMVLTSHKLRFREEKQRGDLRPSRGVKLATKTWRLFLAVFEVGGEKQDVSTEVPNEAKAIMQAMKAGNYQN
jgi:uncharacterized protein (DUF2237 family)